MDVSNNKESDLNVIFLLLERPLIYKIKVMYTLWIINKQSWSTKFDLKNKAMDVNTVIEILKIYLCAFMKRNEYSSCPITTHPFK